MRKNKTAFEKICAIESIWKTWMEMVNLLLKMIHVIIYTNSHISYFKNKEILLSTPFKLFY